MDECFSTLLKVKALLPLHTMFLCMKCTFSFMFVKSSRSWRFRELQYFQCCVWEFAVTLKSPINAFNILFDIFFSSSSANDVAQQIIFRHHPVPASSSVTVAFFVSSFTTSTNLLWGIPSFLLPGKKDKHLHHPLSSISTLPPLHMSQSLLSELSLWWTNL